eukprot:Tbor_TRINITY_DN5240_c1_g9::TRINITY_DN5240_c1_g9_i1::g.16739::m.16739/K13628/iscA; iron-sulfur cluster assembly protein
MIPKIGLSACTSIRSLRLISRGNITSLLGLYANSSDVSMANRDVSICHHKRHFSSNDVFAEPKQEDPSTPDMAKQVAQRYDTSSYKTSRIGRPKPPPSTTTQSPPIPSTSSCTETTGPVEARPLSALQKRQLKMKDKKVFILSQRAVERVIYLLSIYNSTNGEVPIGIRIGIKKRGCSGYSYTVNYQFGGDEKIKQCTTSVEDAIMWEAGVSDSNTSSGMLKKPRGPSTVRPDIYVAQDGVHIFVEAEALFYIIGTVMDYTITNVEEKFTFQNPNQKHSCGCGESFTPFDM